MTPTPFEELLARDVPPEAFVRAGLAALEADFRALVLLALDDWAKRDIVADELFAAVASLQRPSWGMWNGLLSALRNARKAILREGTAAQRHRLEEAKLLDQALSGLDRQAEPALIESLKPLAEITRTSIGTRSKLALVLTMPITLRNRIAHDAPTDVNWWAQAASALNPLISFFASQSLVQMLLAEHRLLVYPSPWFLTSDGQILAFNGIERDYAVLYVSQAGVSRAVPEQTQPLLLALSRLLGRAADQEKDFKRLLSKLAPEEIRGVMMGDWLVGPPVGEGGFAKVHVGRQLSTGRKVAIKILNDGMEPEAIQRFQQEAAFLSRFRHACIVGVYGFGQETWSAPKLFSLSAEPWFQAFSQSAPVKTFIAMEWIEGRTLDEVFCAAKASKVDRPDLATLVPWMAQAASALSAVHAAGLIHRDIKPHNLMITPDGKAADEPQSRWNVKLMDFGIARVQNAARTLMTQSGHTLGTPAYMAPEQIRAGDAESEVGPQSDVYSLCATFYELFTGQRLYGHDRVTMEEVKTLKTSGRRVPRPRLLVHNLPWEIETILLGGLEPEPADRYRSVEALERDLRHFQNDEPIEYRRPSLARRARLVYRRNRAVSNLLVLFFLIATGGIVAYITSITAEQRRTAEQRDLAIRNEAIATEQRLLAQNREREARLSLADLQTGSGHQLLEKGDPAGALLHYVRSLPLSSDVPERDHLTRLRVGITLRQLPRLVRMSPYQLQPRQVVYAAALSSDGRVLVTAEMWGRTAADKSDVLVGGVRRIDVATGNALGEPIPHDSGVFAIGFSGDNSRFVSSCQDGSTRVFQTASGVPVGKAITHDKGLGRAILNPAGDQLLTVTGNAREIRLWDVEHGSVVFAPAIFDRPIVGADLSPDGRSFHAAVAGPDAASDDHPDADIRTYDAATGNAVSPVIRVPSLWATEFSADGKQLVACSGEGWARVFNATTGTPITPMLTHSGPVTRAIFSPDGANVVTVSGDQTARVWNAATGAPVTQPLVHADALYTMTFNRDGTRLATVAYNKTIRLWDVRSGQPLGGPARHASVLQDGTFGPANDDHLLLATQQGMISWDFSRSADPGVVRIRTDRDALGTTFSPNARQLAARSTQGMVRLIDLTSGKIVATLPHPQSVVDVQYAPDGRQVLTACKDGAARLWDLPRAESGDTASTQPTTRMTDAPRAVLRHEAGVVVARFSFDGTRVVTGSDDKTARIWDARTGASILPPLLHKGPVRDVCFSPDGRWLATGSADGSARLWNVETGAGVREPMMHRGGVVRVSFGPGGKELMTADEGGFVHLWNAGSGQLRSRISFGDPVQQASFSPDGKKLLAAGFGSAVKLYDLTDPQQPPTVIPSGKFSAYGCFSADGTLVFTSSFAGRRLWDLGGAPVGPALQSLPLGRGDFSADGRWLATSDSKIRTWDVTPDSRPAADLEMLASLLAGRSLDARGAMVPLTFEEMRQQWETLRTRYPLELTPRDPDISHAPAN